MEELRNPFQIKLIFRASEHGFKASAFHDHCDNIEDTLVLVHTEFDKKIAGFSHYKWNEVDSDFVEDDKRLTFLLQLDSQ